jgi:hypothetical protein
MKYLRSRAGIRGLFTLLSAAASLSLAGCSGSGASEPHGSPVLTKVFWIVGGSSYLVWSKVPDPALVSPVPPAASQVDFVFDRRLDGNRIEEIVTVNGLPTVHPKDPPPVRVSWPDMAATAASAPFSLTSSYDTIPRYGVGSSLVFARPATPGFPSDATVTFTLVPTQLTSAYGEPATVPDSIPVKTAGFTVTIGSTSGAVVPSFQVPLAASNRLPSPPAQSPLVHVSANGGEVPYKLLADATLNSRWFVVPADCLGGVWPAGTTFTVTVDAGFPDAFGGKLKQAATGTFSTSAGASSGVDASCSISDAGASDASDASTSSDAAAPVDASDAAGFDGGATDSDASDSSSNDGGVPDGSLSDGAADVASETASDSGSDSAAVSPG